LIHARLIRADSPQNRHFNTDRAGIEASERPKMRRLDTMPRIFMARALREHNPIAREESKVSKNYQQ
jgi:hypothetical protein